MATGSSSIDSRLHSKDDGDHDFVGFAEEIGKMVAQGDSEAVATQLMTELVKADLWLADHPAPPDPVLAIRLIKTMLGLGVLVASQEDATSQKRWLEGTFLFLMQKASTSTKDWAGTDIERKYSPLIKQLALDELTYVDQYLHSDGRGGAEDVRTFAYEQTRDDYLANPWSPAIRDFNLNLEEWHNRNRIHASLGVPTRDANLTVYAICSVKGGVGKSTTAATLFQYFSEHPDVYGRVLLLDLDSSGPTGQYNFNIPDCSLGMSAVPGRSLDVDSGSDPSCSPWCYHTLWDLVRKVGTDTVHPGIPGNAALIFRKK